MYMYVTPVLGFKSSKSYPCILFTECDPNLFHLTASQLRHLSNSKSFPAVYYMPIPPPPQADLHKEVKLTDDVTFKFPAENDVMDVDPNP